MRIGTPYNQPMLFRVANKKQQEDVDKKDQSEIKQAVKDIVQQRITEIEKARTDKGEDNPKVQQLISKFKSGITLTAEEMSYISKHAPGMVDYIRNIMRERSMYEKAMKAAPSKFDVHMIAIQTSKNIDKYSSSEDKEVRLRHLAKAVHEYEQSEEYKEKPELPLDQHERKPKRMHDITHQNYLAQLVINTYDSTKK